MIPVISQLADKLRDADTVTSELFSDVMRDGCSRLQSLRRTKDFVRLEQLVQSGAWTDAALSLLALEAPQWHLRRLVLDAGEWHCALSRQRELPDWLDQPVEICHTDLSLAILTALVEVKRDGARAAEDDTTNPARPYQALDLPLCCDNFS
jgi:hypothetical protein